MAAIFISHSSDDNALAQILKDWLGSQGYERAFLDFDAGGGIKLGEDWERRLYTEIERCHAVVLLLTPSWLASKWCFAEFVQARALGKSIFPLVHSPEGKTLVAPEIQAVSIDLHDWSDAGRDIIGSRLREITNEFARGFVHPPGRPPFPGINSFGRQDAAVFFGRDEEVRLIRDLLDARRNVGGERLILLVGASGVGKSSILEAGVLPLLEREQAHWKVLPTCRPLDAPLSALAKSLSAAIGDAAGWKQVEDALKADPDTEIRRIANELRIGPSAGATLLLPIDQLEEIYTVEAGGPQRHDAIRVLRSIATGTAPVLAIGTVRADLLVALKRDDTLPLPFTPYVVAPMPLDRVRAVIEGPARVVSVHLQAGLSDRIRKDVVAPETLPLLAFTLREMYERFGQDQRLTISDYEGLGNDKSSPLERAVQLAIERTLQGSLASDSVRSALRQSFIPHLVRIREDGVFVRQPARRSALPEAAHGAIGQLVNARVLSSDNEKTDPTIQVAHEAIFRVWPELAGWLNDERAFLIGLRQIGDAHRTWQEAASERKDAGLLRGILLERARVWHASRSGQLRASGQDLTPYIEQSIARADADTAETAKRAAELETQRRRASQWQRLIAWSAAAVALIMAGFGWMLWNQGGELENALAESRVAHARASHLSGDHFASFALLLQAIDESSGRASGTQEKVFSELRDAYISSRILTASRTVNERLLLSITRDGSRAMSISDDGDITLRDLATGQMVASIKIPKDFETAHINGDRVWLSADAKLAFVEVSDTTFASWRADAPQSVAPLPLPGRIKGWTIVDGAPIVVVKEGTRHKVVWPLTGKAAWLEESEGDSINFRFDRAGTLVVGELADGQDNARRTIWRTINGQRIGGRNMHQYEIIGSYPLNVGGTREYAIADKVVEIRDVASGDILHRVPHEAEIWTIEWSPVDDRLAIGGRSGQLIVVDAISGRIVMSVRQPHSGKVGGLVWSPDGRYVAATGKASDIPVWDTKTGTAIMLRGPGAYVGVAAWLPDSQRLFSTFDLPPLHASVLWDARPDRPDLEDEKYWSDPIQMKRQFDSTEDLIAKSRSLSIACELPLEQSARVASKSRPMHFFSCPR